MYLSTSRATRSSESRRARDSQGHRSQGRSKTARPDDFPNLTPRAFPPRPIVRTKLGSSVQEPDPHSPSPPDQRPGMPEVRPTQTGPRHGPAADLVLPTVPARRLRGAPCSGSRSHRHSARRARITTPRHHRVRRPDPALPRRLPTSPRRPHRPRGRAGTPVQPEMAVDPQGNRRTHRCLGHLSPALSRTLRGDSPRAVGSVSGREIGRTRQVEGSVLPEWATHRL
jgi:hypothetical protein